MRVRHFAQFLCLALLLSGCADVQQQWLLGDDGVVLWRWQACPTVDLTMQGAAERWVSELLPDPTEQVAAWTELRKDRLWFVVQARVPDVQSWRDLRRELVGRVVELVGDVPAMLLPVDLVQDPDGSWVVSVEQTPRSEPERAGQWTLEVRSFDGPDRSSTGRVSRDGTMRWSLPTARLLNEGGVIRARVQRPADGVTGRVSTVLSAAFALAALLVLGWVMRRTKKLAAARRSR